MPLHKVPVGLWRRLRLREGICSRLPPHYLRSLQEARAPAPVHHRPRGAGAGAAAGGRRERVQDVPIPVYRPPEAQLGLWGGEGWVVGYRYVGDDKLTKRVKKVWKPQLLQRELYSEILDTKFAVTVTARTLDLIDAAYGFDFYILKVAGGPCQLPCPMRGLLPDSRGGSVLQVWDGPEARDAAAARPTGPPAAPRQPPEEGSHLRQVQGVCHPGGRSRVGRPDAG
ncbi:39S ribosomal protein L28, mitochondrial isoform X2 [Vulpes lagopus]|uniref:39S ribosomal protein L28, mitochondrial isoform X2 n=1 Tax=Vulpes lagopus TaxID=494514 RepID=UPI001BC96D1B|nr:39S ribosomal protein L28, mitochondrial isoform X2 [Vulpes lagopus]